MKCWKQLLGNKLWVVPKHFSDKWFSRFKAGRTSTDDEESSGRPVSSSMPGKIERVRQIIRKDRRLTTDEVSMLVGISNGTCQKILKKIWSCDVPRLLNVDQNQQRLDVCLDLKKMPLTTPVFFRMSLRVKKLGFTPTTQKTKLNPVNEKVRGHLDQRRQGKWEATSSQCWFVSLIRKELFTKNLFLLIKQLMLHYTRSFETSTGECAKEATWSVAEKHMAAPPWQGASPCCPPDSTVFDR